MRLYICTCIGRPCNKNGGKTLDVDCISYCRPISVTCRLCCCKEHTSEVNVWPLYCFKSMYNSGFHHILIVSSPKKVSLQCVCLNIPENTIKRIISLLSIFTCFIISHSYGRSACPLIASTGAINQVQWPDFFTGHHKVGEGSYPIFHQLHCQRD